MGKIFSVFGVIVLVLILISINQFVYVVHETEQAIVLRFGEPVGERNEAGIYFKTPVIEKVVTLDKRNLEFDMPRPLPITAANEELLQVDAFLRYRITEPLQYYKSFNGGATDFKRIRRTGDDRIRQLLTTNMRNVLGGVSITDIITNRRAELMHEIQTDTARQASRFGITIIDLRIKRADFPDQNAANVYERMKSEYHFEAERLRAEGDEAAQKIRSTADRDVAQILAEAEQKAQEIRGKADAERNAIYNAAYSKDPEFFNFYRSMQSYERALVDGKGQTTYVLSPDSEFFKYFNELGKKN
ncbi:MAG: protease modulator HflC [bacterium]